MFGQTIPKQSPSPLSISTSKANIAYINNNTNWKSRNVIPPRQSECE